MRPSPQFVIDAGAGHVAGAVFADAGEGKLLLEEFTLESRSADPALESGWIERTAQVMASMAARRTRGHAALALPGHVTLTKFVTTPAVAPAKRERVIQFEAAQAIPLPLEAVTWDYLVVAADDREIELMLTAVKRDVMESLCAAAEAAGFPVRRAVASCSALYHAFRFNYAGATAPAMLIDVGARSTNCLLIEPGGRFLARTFAIGGSTVSAAVADALKMDFAEAEALKLQTSKGARRDGDAATAAVRHAAQAFIARLQLEVVRTLDNSTTRTGVAWPAIVYLTGAGSQLAGLKSALAQKLSLPVESYDPWRNLQPSDQARAAGVAEATPLLANLVGLAVSASTVEESEAGLLPPAVRAERAFRRRRPSMLSAATLLVSALLPPLWYFHRETSQDRARAHELEAGMPQLRATADRTAADAKRLAAANEEIAGLQEVAAARFGWIHFLADLQASLGKVEDAWLDQLVVVRGPGARPGVATPASPLQLRLMGRLLDPQSPAAKVNPAAYARAKALLAGIASSRYVSGVDHERFDNAQPGLLRFEVTVTINPQHRL